MIGFLLGFAAACAITVGATVTFGLDSDIAFLVGLVCGGFGPTIGWYLWEETR